MSGFGSFGGSSSFGNFGGFGNKSNTNTGTGFGSFGSSFGQQSNGWNNNQQGQMQQPMENPVSTLLKSYKYIFQNNMNTDDSVFSCVMFDFCPQDKREDFLKDENNRSLYNKHLHDNPDPENMVPIVVSGFEGLKDRIEKQKSAIQNISNSMEVFQNAIKRARSLVTEHDSMARQCELHQAQLEEQLIRVIGKLESRSMKSQVIITNEKFVETLAKLQRLQSRLSAIYNALNTYGITVSEEEVELKDAESLLKFLENQEAALEKIVHILKQTQKELQLILTDPFVHITYRSGL